MHTWAKWVTTLFLLALIALSWSRDLDDAAQAATLSNFKRALAVAAIARGFNGVLSVAQGTEIAVQPVGVGVTLTIGEILDPLNDLIERFSALALVASVSLGLQLTLGQMVTSAWLSAVMSIAALAYLFMLWRPPAARQVLYTYTLRVVAAFVFVRFMLAVTLLTTHFIDSNFLAARQDQATQNLRMASSTIERLQDQQARDAAETDAKGDFFDRTAAQLSSILDASSQTLDMKAQIREVEAQVENSVEEIVNLIVIFLLQTLLLPVASLWLCWRALQTLWHRPAP